jgi:hypothetical protein
MYRRVVCEGKLRGSGLPAARAEFYPVNYAKRAEKPRCRAYGC